MHIQMCMREIAFLMQCGFLRRTPIYDSDLPTTYTVRMVDGQVLKSILAR